MAEKRNLKHNSQDIYYRSPAGAVVSGTPIRLALDVDTDEIVTSVIVRVWQENTGETLLTLQEKSTGSNGTRYAGTIQAADRGTLMWYYFIVNTKNGKFFYGNNPEHLGGCGQCYDETPASYQITVVYKGAKTPDWFKRAVMYQIFPDRFCRQGDRIVRKKNAVIHADWEDTPFYYKDVDTKEIVAYDFFGGNLAGIREKLPYLKELGISVIYLNPIFESASNHHYDTGDYHKVDPLLGTNEEFVRLTAYAKELDIRIILDGVFSHTGSDSRYFNRDNHYDTVGAFQSQRSPYYEWYSFKRYPYEYDSWWGFYTLPNVNETTRSYMDFIIDEEDSVLKYWLKAGVSGWRLDVIDELPPQFSQHFYKVLKETDQDAVMIGEVWEDASNKISYGVHREYLCGREMDSAMNYPFRQVVLDFLLGHSDAGQINRRLLSLKENYPPENFYAMMNLIGSHDVERVLTLLGEAPYYEGMPAVNQGRFHLDNDHFNLGVARLKMAVLWQMTFPGVPCVYYGDEIGMQGYKDPFNRGPYKWKNGDTYVQSWYKKVIALRNSSPALQTGSFMPLYSEGEVYAYVRMIHGGHDVFGHPAPNDVFIVILNRSRMQAMELDLNVERIGDGEFKEVFNGRSIKPQHGWLHVGIQALEGLVYRMETDEAGIEHRAGILLHPTSLPSAYGIGDFGPEAYAFIDFLVQAGQKLWQILPLNPIGHGYSPYQSTSAFAGNPLLLSPELLVGEGLLSPQYAVPSAIAGEDIRVDFAAVEKFKERCLRRAWKTFKDRQVKNKLYTAFCSEQRFWLDDYALFIALKKEFASVAWTEWPADIKHRTPAAMNKYRVQLADEIEYQKFLQYEFFHQWGELHAYAKEKGVQIIGDMPIFLAHDSADVWANQCLFSLDRDGKAQKVAGVPPDYFSATGQLWGNPHYLWDKMKADDYDWWRKRFKTMLALVDIVRIDHFRGFESYWEIDSSAATAVEGRWVKGPGWEFFQTIARYFGRLPIIAEDLGIITPEVEKLRDSCGFPGMKVLHFDLRSDENNQLSFDCPQNSVVYTGTHDNNTTVGWVENDLQTPVTAASLAEFIGAETEKPAQICSKLIEFAYASPAATVIVPLQDVLCLGTAARMNLPGTVGSNWQWRVKSEQLSAKTAARLAELCKKYKR